MPRTKTRTKTRLKSRVRQMRFTTSRIKSVLFKVSKTTLIDCFMILFRAAPKKVQLRVAIKLEKSPKRLTRREPRKTSKKKSKGRRGIRTAKQKAATRKLIAFNRRRRR